jgi:pimeloyl-ACP methyl ester carboxylesterase
VVLVFGGWLYLRQNALIFQPSRDDGRSPASVGIPFEDVYLRADGGVTIHGWWVAGSSEKVIIFFHGHLGNMSHELASLRFLRTTRHSVLMVEYPGYGKSGGSPSERGCYQAAEVAWSFLVDRGAGAEDIVVFGRSLGAAVATYLASSRQCGGLVFHSGFTSMPDVAARRYPYLPARWFCRTKMNSLQMIKSCRCPLLLLHSEMDEINPIAKTLVVYKRAPGPKKIVRYHGSHNSNEWQCAPEVRVALNELLSGAVERWERR